MSASPAFVALDALPTTTTPFQDRVLMFRQHCNIANLGGRGGGKTVSLNRFLREVRELFDVRHKYLPPDFVELQLHDIQFYLCERGKYLRAKSGNGKPKRRYAA